MNIDNIKFKVVKEKTTEYGEKVKITSSESAAKIFKNIYGDDVYVNEKFYVMFLNRANGIQGINLHSTGSDCGTVVSVRDVCKMALDLRSHNVILCHNHPSGALEASQQDKQITTKVKDALKLFDINVMDHIIITADSYFSFADNGLIY